jgi:hypothetical protein
LLAGCAHCPVDTPIGLPERPDLIPVTPEVWSTVGPEAQDTWTLNDLALKQYARQLEERIRLHDERLD